jgi:hypothetical protein
VFAAHLRRIARHDVAALRLAGAASERVVELTRALDRYAYGFYRRAPMIIAAQRPSRR